MSFPFVGTTGSAAQIHSVRPAEGKGVEKQNNVFGRSALLYRLTIIAVLLSLGNNRFLRMETVFGEEASVGKYDTTRLKGIRSSGGIVAPFDSYHNFTHGPRPRRCVVGLSAMQLQNYTAQNPYTNVNATASVPFPGWFESRQYAAAWLSSIETFRSNPNYVARKGGANLEYGTFSTIEWRAARVFRSLDYFDFYVQHLSNWPKRFDHTLRRSGGFNHLYRRRLRDMESTYVELGYNNPSGHRNGRVLVIMPFHSPGDGHSKKDDKYSFLNLTVKTVSNIFPNIVVSVCNRHDYDYVTTHSGLNQFLYDVMMVDLEESTHLPYFSSVDVRHRIEQGQYDVGFEFIYFTEADQPPHLRDVNWLLHLTLQQTNGIVNPHRGHPDGMPGDLATNISSSSSSEQSAADAAAAIPETEVHVMKLRQHFEPAQSRTIHDVADISTKSCCFNHLHLKRPYEFSKEDKKGMIDLYNYRGKGEVEWFRQHDSFAHVLGICNEFRHYCCTCNLTDGITMCQYPPSS